MGSIVCTGTIVVWILSSTDIFWAQENLTTEQLPFRGCVCREQRKQKSQERDCLQNWELWETMLLLLEVFKTPHWPEITNRILYIPHPQLPITRNPLLTIDFVIYLFLCKQNHTIGIWFLTLSTMFSLWAHIHGVYTRLHSFNCWGNIQSYGYIAVCSSIYQLMKQHFTL